jgi:hypothetical protein
MSAPGGRRPTRCVPSDDRDLAHSIRKYVRPDAAPGAPQSTVEAVIYRLREAGSAALNIPNWRQRLGELSVGQINEVMRRLIRLRSRYPAITDELFLMLDELR